VASLIGAGVKSSMRILLSNDDGYFAPGLAALAEALAKIAEIVVVAPERDRSGASNSLTLDRPLIVRKSHLGFFYINGTPTDCVHLAVTGLLDTLPDMIVSGINHGANMGDDTIYSGTVAAATEGFLLGIPSLAVSLAKRSDGNYLTAARVAVDLVSRYQEQPLGPPVLLNVNVPDVAYDKLRGFEVTRLGRRVTAHSHAGGKVKRSAPEPKRRPGSDRKRSRTRTPAVEGQRPRLDVHKSGVREGDVRADRRRPRLLPERPGVGERRQTSPA